VRILSGVFEGRTTGTPISLMIENVDQRSKDYSEVARPIAPAMPTMPMTPSTAFATIAAAGALSRARRRRGSRRARGAAGDPRSRDPGYRFRDRRRCHRSAPISMRPRSATTRSSAPMPAARALGEDSSMKRARPDPRSARWSNAWPPACRRAGARRSMASSMRPGAAMMGINAVKGVEIGDGFAAARLTGEQNADPMRPGRNGPACSRQPRRRHRGRHLDRAAGGGARRLQADQLDPDPVDTDHPRRRGDRDVHQGPPRPLRRHSRRAGGRGDDGAGARRRSQAAAPAQSASPPAATALRWA
jgi:hypothetical protein